MKMNQKLDKKLALDPKMLEIAQLGVLNFGKISISYLMRKLKCSESMAKEICIALGQFT